MNVKQALESFCGNSPEMYFNDIEVIPEKIAAVLINEVVPADPKDDFYGGPGAAYLSTAMPLFQNAGVLIPSPAKLLEEGIYLTNAVKTPKTEYAISRDSLEQSLPLLEKELSLFPNIKVILLMGDVAKKAFNRIAKKDSGKNVIPAVSTYKLRGSEFYYRGVRIIPSYIMTGQNILIEKSKFSMASEDIAAMYRILSGV